MPNLNYYIPISYINNPQVMNLAKPRQCMLPFMDYEKTLV